MAVYNDRAVFMPGRGAVLVGDVGAQRPSLDDVNAWIQNGATGELGEYLPFGYTSIDELPAIGTETEGGEVRGAWENASLRTTRQTVTDTVTVKPIQWTETPLRHRFGPGTVQTDTGVFEVPAVYTATEVSLTVIFIDGNTPLVIHIPRLATAPEGGIEPDPEDFLALPILYTVLVAMGQPKMSIMHDALRTTSPIDGGEV